MPLLRFLLLHCFCHRTLFQNISPQWSQSCIHDTMAKRFLGEAQVHWHGNLPRFLGETQVHWHGNLPRFPGKTQVHGHGNLPRFLGEIQVSTLTRQSDDGNATQKQSFREAKRRETQKNMQVKRNCINPSRVNHEMRKKFVCSRSYRTRLTPHKNSSWKKTMSHAPLQLHTVQSIDGC